jgi:hypothetical protein
MEVRRLARDAHRHAGQRGGQQGRKGRPRLAVEDVIDGYRGFGGAILIAHW